MNAGLWLLVVALAVACAFVASSIAARKHRNPAVFFVLGLVLSLMGVAIAKVLPSRAPAGSRPIKCPRCNAVTNVPDGQSEFQCWQCQLESPVPDRPQSSFNLDDRRYKFAKVAVAVISCALVVVFFVSAFQSSDLDDNQDTMLMVCFRDKNGPYIGANSRPAVEACEREHEAYSGGPRWRELKQNVEDWDVCIAEARAQMARGNWAKFDECDEISNRQ
jgi:hypothetical protein